MLHIDFLCLVPGERQVKPVQLALFLIVQPFISVEEVGIDASAACAALANGVAVEGAGADAACGAAARCARQRR